MYATVNCPACGGTGEVTFDEWSWTCGRCDGWGFVTPREAQRIAFGQMCSRAFYAGALEAANVIPF